MAPRSSSDVPSDIAPHLLPRIPDQAWVNREPLFVDEQHESSQFYTPTRRYSNTPSPDTYRQELLQQQPEAGSSQAASTQGSDIENVSPLVGTKTPESRTHPAHENFPKFRRLDSVSELEISQLPETLRPIASVKSFPIPPPLSSHSTRPRQSVSFVEDWPSFHSRRASLAYTATQASLPSREKNPFEHAFTRGRQQSEIGPFDQPPCLISTVDSQDLQDSDQSESDHNIPHVRRSSLAHIQARWSSFASFSNPFDKSQHSGISPEDLRPGSVFMERRPSTFQRMMSVGGTPHPIPQRYRSKSVSSLAFYLSSAESSNSQLPIFEDDIESQKQNVEEYLAGVDKLQASTKRKPWESKLFQTAYFFISLAIIFFVFVGKPIWPGIGVLYYRWVHSAGLGSSGSIVFIGWAAFQAFVPLLFAQFELEVDSVESRDASETALVIPAYKAAAILPETIQAALQIFKPDQIFIINNGNTEVPADNTAEVCKKYGVNHAYVPIGSKITAEFVGIALTRAYKYILLIDDDVHLPANFPLVTNRIQGDTRCVGYTIKSTGANGSKGTLVQQCQNVEYTMAGLSKVFSSKYGSATFPHGAIILWDRVTLQNLFNVHPGYTISEDWFFGHGCRSMGYCIDFCSQVFVETETPPEFLWSSTAARGGFGEMTVFKQRFSRWNYFLGMRLWEDTIYILFSWRLGFREIITKFFVLIEIYDSVMSFLRPWILALTLIDAWKLFLELFAITVAMYIGAFVLFNAYHLRRKKEMVSWKVLPMYMWMKSVLLYVNCLSAYYGLYSYARFFSVRHPRVIESRKALEAAYNVRLGTRLIPLDTAMEGSQPDLQTEKVISNY